MMGCHGGPMMTTATTVVASAASLTTCALISIRMKKEER